MPINVDLLIAAPMLQDYLVDKDGTPMAGGTITCYQDNSRTTLKNWYYQSGTPGNYTYIRLPNPLTLSAAGTICDLNGVDTIPFFYPYSELDQSVFQPYYITIVNHAMTNQITRANFPFVPNGGTNPSTNSSFDNIIVNNEFWRNIGSMNLTNVTDTTVCPSQHDGFSGPDITFSKNVTGGQDTVTFTKFPLTKDPILTGDITPEYYLNHTCSNTPTGENRKNYLFPISLHVNTLASVPFTVTIQGQNTGGTGAGQNTINLFIFQNTGTGTTPPLPFLIGSISLSSAWTKYDFTSVFPATAGLTLGTGQDDALYLVVQMPLNVNCSINFCKPSIYLSTTVPTNNFQSYDEIDSIINSPRTGDIRTSLNAFIPWGWVPLNGGTIGYNPGSPTYAPTTRNNQDTWQLYNLIWSLFKPFNSGSTNILAQMYLPSSAATAYGATAYADFTAGNPIALTQAMGKVILGGAPPSVLISNYLSTFTGAATTITPTFTMNLFNGMPIYFTGTATLTANLIYYVGNFNGTTFQVFTTFNNAITQTSPKTVDATGTIISCFNGSFEGEYQHTQLLVELAAHNHTVIGAAASAVAGAGATALGGTTTTSTTGSSRPFNVTQPGVFYNMYMKL